MSADAAVESKPATESPEPEAGGRLIPPWWVWIVVALAVVVILLTQVEVLYAATLQNVKDDGSVRNVLAWISGFIATLVVVGWLVFASGFPAVLRGLAALAFFLVLAAIPVFFSGFTGDMWPKFSSADSLLIQAFTGEATPDIEDVRFVAQAGPEPNPPKEPANPDEVAEPAAVALTATDQDWPQFLGKSQRNAVSGVRLATDWDAEPPKEVARFEVGAGWGGFALVGDYAYTLEQQGPYEVVAAYDIPSGDKVWAHAEEARHQNLLGGVGPRSTPTFYQGKLYALGATGWLHCLDAATGKLLWQKNLQELLGVSQAEDEAKVRWGRANSPLIVDDKVVVPLGGRPGQTTSLIAFDRETGAEAWRGGDSQISYATPVLETIDGVRQILVVNEDNVAGHNPVTGEQLWSFPFEGNSAGPASNTQPFVVMNNHVFVSKGYSVGGKLVQLTRLDLDDSQWRLEEVWAETRPKTKLSNPVIHDAYVYGIDEGILSCVAVADGQRMWKKNRVGHGQMLRVGDKLLVLAEFGTLYLIDANPDKYDELASFEAIEGQTWNHMAFRPPLLAIRNAEEAVFYKLPIVKEN